MANPQLIKANSSRLPKFQTNNLVSASGLYTPYDLNYPRNAVDGVLPQLWLDAMDPAAVARSSTGLVNTWYDKSDNGFHATASGAERPSYGTRTFNGKPCIDFNTATNAMACGLSASIANRTVFLVLTQDTAAAQQTYLGGTNTGSMWVGNSVGPINLLQQVSTVGTIYQNVTIATSTLYVLTAQTERTASWAAVHIVADITLNGTSSGNTSGVALAQPSASRTTIIGATNNGAGNVQFFDGAICEIIVYHAVLTSTAYALIRNWLIRKWK